MRLAGDIQINTLAHFVPAVLFAIVTQSYRLSDSMRCCLTLALPMASHNLGLQKGQCIRHETDHAPLAVLRLHLFGDFCIELSRARKTQYHTQASLAILLLLYYMFYSHMSAMELYLCPLALLWIIYISLVHGQRVAKDLPRYLHSASTY